MGNAGVSEALGATPGSRRAWAKGADLTLIASGVDQLLETVVTGPNIKSPADLKNKKIGVSRYGSLTDMALREALRHYKLTPDKDVTILQTGGEATRFAALTTGAIDGAMLSGDKKVQAEKMGFHVTIDLSQLPIYYPVNGVVASKKFLASNPESAPAKAVRAAVASSSSAARLDNSSCEASPRRDRKSSEAAGKTLSAASAPVRTQTQPLRPCNPSHRNR